MDKSRSKRRKRVTEYTQVRNGKNITVKSYLRKRRSGNK
jgi:hypothetical protein